MPGPLPDPNRRRRNKPTIPTTALPAEGYQGPVPKPPRVPALGGAGKAWWRWAWRTPQAAAWSSGDLVALARRASLEDDLEAMARVDGIDLDGIEKASELKALIVRLATLCVGRLAIQREMRELDNTFGLTAKGLAALRWRIVETAPEEQEQPRLASVTRIPAVDPRAAAQ